MRPIGPIRLITAALCALVCAACQTTTPIPEFAPPTSTWKTKTGQLAYRSPKTSLIGEVLVRYSPNGEMELSFSKGPGLNLLVIRQNAEFARVEGPLARRPWEGRVASAPERLRGWLSLRTGIVAGRPSIQETVGAESFHLRF